MPARLVTLKEPGAWVHTKRRNRHEDLEHLPGAHHK